MAAFRGSFLVLVLSAVASADKDCGESCPGAKVPDPVLLQISSKPARHGGSHAERANKLQSCVAATSTERAEIVKKGKEVLEVLGYCPSWDRIKMMVFQKAFIQQGGLASATIYDPSVIQRWSDLRSPMLNLGFDCAKDLAKPTSEYNLVVPPASTADPTSDIDATLSGPNPTPYLSHTLIFMADVLKELGCAIVQPDSSENMVAHYFDTNIYGNLVSLSMDTFEAMGWPAATRELFQEGREEKIGRKVMYLKNVCDIDIMDKSIDKRIDDFAKDVASAEWKGTVWGNTCVEHPVEVVIDQAKYEKDLNKFWAAMAKGDVYSDTPQSWIKLFHDLAAITANQRESYLSYAGTFDVVMERASGLVLSARDKESKQCIDHVASRDSLLFLLEHIFHDKIGIQDWQRLGYLVETSKYWDRLFDSVMPSEDCRKLRQGSAAIKKCGPCKQAELQCGLEFSSSTPNQREKFCAGTNPEDGMCEITAEDQTRSCKTYRAMGREVVQTKGQRTTFDPKLEEYLTSFDKCVGFEDLEKTFLNRYPQAKQNPSCKTQLEFQKLLFEKLRSFGTNTRTRMAGHLVDRYMTKAKE